MCRPHLFMWRNKKASFVSPLVYVNCWDSCTKITSLRVSSQIIYYFQFFFKKFTFFFFSGKVSAYQAEKNKIFEQSRNLITWCSLLCTEIVNKISKSNHLIHSFFIFLIFSAKISKKKLIFFQKHFQKIKYL
jgi:hypothetical protein